MVCINESGIMNITMLHDLDTGFLASTLKPAFQALGHTCTVCQTMTTYLDPEGKHVDYLLKDITEDMHKQIIQVFKETDLFIIRSITDSTLHIIGVLPYLNKHNTIYRVHGSELREKNVPYSLRTWRINWHNKEPIIVAPRDPSLFPLYRKNTITHIERPCAFDTFPKKHLTNDIYALHTPTNPNKKGTYELIDKFNEQGTIQLRIVHGAPRQEILNLKAGASYFIDYLGSYEHGPYGMNSVEAWFYKIPVFSVHKPIDYVLVPELHNLVHNSSLDTIQDNILHYTPDRKQLSFAKQYALTTHSPSTIASQYIALYHYIQA